MHPTQAGVTRPCGRTADTYHIQGQLTKGERLEGVGAHAYCQHHWKDQLITSQSTGSHAPDGTHETEKILRGQRHPTNGGDVKLLHQYEFGLVAGGVHVQTWQTRYLKFSFCRWRLVALLYVCSQASRPSCPRPAKHAACPCGPATLLLTWSMFFNNVQEKTATRTRRRFFC